MQDGARAFQLTNGTGIKQLSVGSVPKLKKTEADNDVIAYSDKGQEVNAALIYLVHPKGKLGLRFHANLNQVRLSGHDFPSVADRRRYLIPAYPDRGISQEVNSGNTETLNLVMCFLPRSSIV